VRDTYHQSVGNPLQREYLPDTLPDTEFPIPEPPHSKVMLLLGAACSLMATGWMAGRFVPQIPADGLTFYILAALWFTIVSLQFPPFFGHIVWLSSLALMILSNGYLIEIPTLVWRLAVAVGLGWLASDLLRHGGEHATCSPLGRADRESCRRRWLGYAWVVRLVPSLAVLLALRIPLPHFAESVIGLWSLISMLQAVRRYSISQCPRLALASWRSWLTYNPKRWNAPGSWQSPSPRYWVRIVVLFTTIYTLAHMHASSPWVNFWARDFLLDAVLLFVVPIALALPVLVEAQLYRADPASQAEWERITDGVRNSACPVERESVYLGRVVSDGSPVLIPRSVYHEHAHILGDSGSGKTSLGLLPLLEQLVAGGDCSVVVLDMKGDSNELLTTLQAAVERVRSQTGRGIPIKHFTNRADRSTFAFNPLTQPYWDNLEPYVRTDLLADVLGLFYGTDYGSGYFSSVNAAVLHYVLTKYPQARTFRELAERVQHALATANKRELRDELKQAAGHVHMILSRLGSFDALNVGPNDNVDASVREQSMDFTSLFRDPGLFYFSLSATLAPGTAPEIGRLAIASLLGAAAQTVQRRQVFLVIDEFQRVVAQNLATLFQQARSLNIGVILANQAMQDLKTPHLNMIPTLESNCRLRQWFAVSSSDDRKRLSEGSGQTVEQKATWNYGLLRPDWVWLNKFLWAGISTSEDLKPRISENEVMLMTSDPNQSILTVTRGAGYAQYGGLPVIIESHFHIPETEYKRRRMMPWPGVGNGAFIPRDERTKQPPTPPRKPGPKVTGEVVGDRSAERRLPRGPG
jgi:hypothetical protein